MIYQLCSSLKISLKELKMTKAVILTSRHKAMVPIIKVVGDFCNLRCKYCFYSGNNQSEKRVMSQELLKRFLSQYLELFSRHLTFIWHGGEPLLAGLPFFRKLVEIQRKYLKDGQMIRNAIQTNATLITDEWAVFFKDNDFKVGVSLDGCRESHDRFRVNAAGRGSFDQVIEGIEILRRYGIQPGIILTLTADNLICADKDFDFFANMLNAKSWGANILFDTNGTNGVMAKQHITNEELIKYLKTCIDLWLIKDDAKLRIREIENFIAGVFGKKAPSCIFNGSCTGYFCLDYDGKIYPCDRSSNCPEFLFGDLSNQSLLEILNGSARLTYAEAVNSIHPDCVDCKWQKACHNGCAMQRVGSTCGKYYYCEARKAIFEYLKIKIEKFKLAQ